MAKLLETLGADGAAVVAFDILFSEPDRTSPEQALKQHDAGGGRGAGAADRRQGRATTRSSPRRSPRIRPSWRRRSPRAPSPPPPLKAGFATVGDDPKNFVPTFAGANVNLPILDEAATGIGSINWIPDRDQVVRRIPLIYRVGDQYVPTLTTEALRVAQQAGTYVLKGSNASGETAFGQQTGLNHIRVGADRDSRPTPTAASGCTSGRTTRAPTCRPGRCSPARSIPDAFAGTHRAHRHQRARPHRPPRDAARCRHPGRRDPCPGDRADPARRAGRRPRSAGRTMRWPSRSC